MQRGIGVAVFSLVCPLLACLGCGQLLGIDNVRVRPDAAGNAAGDASPPAPIEAGPGDATMPIVEAGPPLVDSGSLPDARNDGAVSPDAGPCSGGCGGATCFEGVCNGALIVQVTGGTGGGCALTKAGSVWCWGDDQLGQLGVSPTSEPSTCDWGGGTLVACNPIPAEVSGLHDVIQVTMGDAETCAIERDNSVWCWGSNSVGQLGHVGGDANCDGTTCNWTPSLVPGVAATQLSMFGGGPCAVTTSGEVACWGDNANGQLGNGTMGGTTSIPEVIPNFEGVTKVVSEGTTVCALRTDGSVSCWGCMGTSGAANCVATPTPVYQADGVTPAFGPASDAGTAPATDIGVGYQLACAIVGGEVWCWGDDRTGLVGPAASGSHAYPTKLAPIEGATSLSVGLGNACAQLADGGALCWGEDEWGELGVGYQNADAAAGNCSDGLGCFPPLAPQVDGALLQIDATWCMELGLRNDGTVWAWGINNTARLGHAPGQDGDQTCHSGGQTFPCNPTPKQVIFPGLP